MSLRDYWKYRANHIMWTRVETKAVHLNIFNAQGVELNEMGTLLRVPRAQPSDPLGQYAYRLQLIARVLHIAGPNGGQMHDAMFEYPIALNGAAVAVGTYRNDPRAWQTAEDGFQESDDQFRDRIQAIAMKWLMAHGDTSHQCMECTK